MKALHPRRLNPRRAKLHRSYTAEEIADLFGVHKNTIRNWIRAGLKVVDSQRPLLILGSELFAFLSRRRTESRKRCGRGELFCLRCRLPRSPVDGRVQYSPQTPLLGCLTGSCGHCGARMNRRASVMQLRALAAEFDLQTAEGLEHIAESEEPSLNCDLKG